MPSLRRRLLSQEPPQHDRNLVHGYPSSRQATTEDRAGLNHTQRRERQHHGTPLSLASQASDQSRMDTDHFHVKQNPGVSTYSSNSNSSNLPYIVPRHQRDKKDRLIHDRVLIWAYKNANNCTTDEAVEALLEEGQINPLPPPTGRIHWTATQNKAAQKKQQKQKKDRGREKDNKKAKGKEKQKKKNSKENKGYWVSIGPNGVTRRKRPEKHSSRANPTQQSTHLPDTGRLYENSASAQNSCQSEGLKGRSSVRSGRRRFTETESIGFSGNATQRLSQREDAIMARNSRDGQLAMVPKAPADGSYQRTASRRLTQTFRASAGLDTTASSFSLGTRQGEPTQRLYRQRGSASADPAIDTYITRPPRPSKLAATSGARNALRHQSQRPSSTQPASLLAALPSPSPQQNTITSPVVDSVLPSTIPWGDNTRTMVPVRYQTPPLTIPWGDNTRTVVPVRYQTPPRGV